MKQVMEAVASGIAIIMTASPKTGIGNDCPIS